jgi:hypothetical protein
MVTPAAFASAVSRVSASAAGAHIRCPVVPTCSSADAGTFPLPYAARSAGIP